MNKAIVIFALLVIVLACTEASKRPNPQRPDCLRLKCDNPSKKLICVRSKKNNCVLLTACQVSRVNCQRGPLNVLARVSSRRCAGMKHGQKMRKCRPAPKKRG
ncbi:uncharacterized protein LOC135959219 [Calliphora vicina]|uniref:uncharacterized protein LOC135959219 n=1 Tax=Calliphora vicina TaxID=7373 RepID=UPI00325B665D